MRRILIYGFLLSVLLAIYWPNGALADGPSAAIVGSILNGTEGAGIVADHEVKLRTYQDYVPTGDFITTRTDAEGRFQFEDIQPASDSSYVVLMTYQGADYYSDPILFTEDETTRTVDIDVFDSTEDDAAISILIAHTIIRVQEGQLMVTEYLAVENADDRTYIGTMLEGSTIDRETFRFLLPDNTGEVQAEMGLEENYTRAVDGGFVDTRPIFPGTKEYAYNYALSALADSYTISKQLEYPAASVVVLAQEDGLEVSSDVLDKADSANMGGTRFATFVGENVPADTAFGITLTGLLSSDDGGSSDWLIWASIVALAVLAITYIILRSRRVKRDLPSERVSGDSDIEVGRERLLEELAALDDRYERGDITQDVYQDLRATKKAELIELMKEHR